MNQINLDQSHELGSFKTRWSKGPKSAFWAILLLCSALNTSMVFAQALPPANRCDSVKAGEDINFRQIKLREIADISNPEIRRINALISARCYEEATSAYSEFVAANPNDFKIRFVEGRMLWIFDDAAAARKAMAALIEQHPDFASAKVLMASLHLDANELDQARKMLDQAAKTSPNDLWLFIDRLKLERISATADTPKKYLEVLKNPQFPPSAREEVGLDYPYLRGVSPAMAEDAYKTLLTFESATPHHMKAAIVAFFLVTKKESKSEQKIDQIKALLADPRNQGRAAVLDHLLRIAYLQHANVLDSKPSSKNAKWVELARDGVDIDALHTYVLTYPDMGPAIPLLTNFLGLKIDQNALDQYGATELCRAVQAFDVNRVKAALKASADPNGSCGGGDVLWMATMSSETRFMSERKKMVVLLLEHGATRDYVSECEQNNLGNCKTSILPILKQFAAKKP